MESGGAETARLRLHPWRAGVFDDALAAVNAEPEAMRYLTGGVPMTRAETTAQSARFADHWARHGFGLWAAEVKATGRVIGFVGLSHPEWFPELAHAVEVGWRLHPGAWGHGYATEGGEAGLRWAFETLGLERVIALIDAANERSLAVAARLGLRRARVVPHPSKPVDVVIAAIDRATWGGVLSERPGEVVTAAGRSRDVDSVLS